MEPYKYNNVSICHYYILQNHLAAMHYTVCGYLCTICTIVVFVVKAVILLLLYLSSGVRLAMAYLPFLHLFFPLLTFLSLRSLSPVSTSFILLLLFSILLPLFSDRILDLPCHTIIFFNQIGFIIYCILKIAIFR